MINHKSTPRDSTPLKDTNNLIKDTNRPLLDYKDSRLISSLRVGYFSKKVNGYYLATGNPTILQVANTIYLRSEIVDIPKPDRPTITGACLFKPSVRWKTKNIHYRTGLMAFDIDDAPFDIDQVRFEFINVNRQDFTPVLIYRSPSGKGLKALIYLHKSHWQGHHNDTFEAVASYVRDKYGWPINIKSNKGLIRQSFLNYDPEVRYNATDTVKPIDGLKTYDIEPKKDTISKPKKIVNNVDQFDAGANSLINSCIDKMSSTTQKRNTLFHVCGLIGGLVSGGRMSEYQGHETCQMFYALRSDEYKNHNQAKITLEDGFNRGLTEPLYNKY